MSDWQEIPCETEYEGWGRFHIYFPDKKTALARVNEGSFRCPACGARYSFEAKDAVITAAPRCSNGHDETVCEEAA